MKNRKNVVLYNGKEMNIQANSVAIDPKKIRKELEQRKLTQVDVSMALGYGRNTLCAAISTGIFPGHMVNGLDRQYNIKLEDYEYKAPEKNEPVKEDVAVVQHEPVQPLTDTALYNVMKNAMLDAMTEALARNMGNLRGMVLSAIRTAAQ